MLFIKIYGNPTNAILNINIFQVFTPRKRDNNLILWQNMTADISRVQKIALKINPYR